MGTNQTSAFFYCNLLQQDQTVSWHSFPETLADFSQSNKRFLEFALKLFQHERKEV